MNFKNMVLALRHVRASKPRTPTHQLALRVAARRIIQALGLEYDVLFRLQVLEGAAGVRVGTWWTKGRRGLKGAADALSGTDINPEWFNTGNTGMANYLLRVANNVVRQFRLTHLGGEDLLQNALMGLKIDGSPGAKQLAYTAGTQKADNITSGKETPKTLVHVVAAYLKHKASNETKALRRMDMDKGDSPTTEVQQDPKDFFGWFAHIVFGNMGHPLGKKIRKFMRDSWKGTGQEESMDIWLDAIERGERLDTKEVAARAGIAPGTFSSRHLTPAWRRFAKEVWSNSSLIREIKQQAAGEGILWVPDKPNLDALVDYQKGKPVPILRKRKRSSQYLVGHVAARWMISCG